MLQTLSSGAQPVTQIAGGCYHSLFVRNDGSLWGVGDDVYGQLGDGIYNRNNQRNRAELILASNVTAIATGWYHSLFLKSDGSLWAMGRNNYGQLGDGTYGMPPWEATNLSEQIVASDVTAIAAGGNVSLFLKKNGSLWAMGDNEYGALGDGVYEPANRPEQIVASNVTAIAAGRYHGLFLKNDGSLWAMGDNTYGEMGDGTHGTAPSFSTNRPKQIVSSNVTAVAAGNGQSFFLKSGGSLWAMGYNADGELGDGTTNNVNLPEQIVASNVTAIAVGATHSLFLKSDGSLWAMGDNRAGQLGDGTTNNASRPKQIVIGGVTTIAAGWHHSLFLKSDGSLWGMGYNVFGALGDGTYNNTNRPERIVATR